MKTPATTKVMTSAPNSLNSTTAQNLSKYAHKILKRSAISAAEAGFSVSTHHGQVFVISQYGLKKAFSTLDDATKYLGGLV
jgi:hypothetical protein